MKMSGFQLFAVASPFRHCKDYNEKKKTKQKKGKEIHDILLYRYAHPFCLENIGKCEGCYDNFERRQQSKTTMTEWPFVENNRRAIYVFIAFTTISLIWDVVSCISIDKVDQQELGNTIKSEYIWLPVKQNKSKMHKIF